MVDFAVVATRDLGLSPTDAICRAAILRFCSIMVTTMAAMLGGVPLMLARVPAQRFVSRSDTPWSGVC